MGAVYPDQNDVTPNFVTPSGVEPYEPKPQTFGQKASDAFLLNNDVVNLHRRMNEQQYPVDPDHNPKDMLTGPNISKHYWDNYSDNFIASRSEPQTRDIMRRIDEEEAAKARSAESGPMGTVLDLAAGVLSPTVFLPAGQIVRSARGGYSALRSAASVGVAGGLQTAAQEAILQGTQETRTLHESLINVGSGTILAGILGAGGSKLLQIFEQRQAEAAVARARLQVDAHNGVDILNTPPTEGFDVVPHPQVAAGIEAFHGSPHDFESFDLSKIGTGEGAQSYGHGLYFAENEGVAKNYQELLAGQSENMAEQLANQALRHADADRSKAATSLRERARAEESDPFSGVPPALMREAADKLDNGWAPKSALYKVRIHADREHMLDWDKPLSEQTPHVRSALTDAGLVNPDVDSTKAGSLIYRDLVDHGGGIAAESNAARQSEILHEAGIPGIKYLDQGSRKQPLELSRRGVTGVDHFEYATRAEAEAHIEKYVQNGDDRSLYAIKEHSQTSNFVIFDDKLLTIIEKNGEKIDVRPFRSLSGGATPLQGGVYDAIREAYRKEVASGSDAWMAPISIRQHITGFKKNDVIDALDEMINAGEVHETTDSVGNRSVAMLGNKPAPTPSKAARDVEHIISPAIEADGKIFAAGSHSDAYNKAIEGIGHENFAVKYDDGWLTSTGRLVTRDEAGQIAEKSGQVQFSHPLHSDEILEPFVPPAAPSGGMGSIGAAATDTRQLEMFPAYPGMNTPGKSVSPIRTLLNATSLETRRIAADLASAPYRFKENVEGVATTQGAPVDIQLRMAIDGTEYQIGQALKEHYSDYFFGEQKRAPVLQARYQRFTGASDKMSYDEFKAEVSKAWMNNGTHELPQASAAAQAIMEKVEDWAKRADVSIEGFKRGEQATGEAYFPHLWNKKLIQGQKPEFINWLTGKYKADQLTKQGAQERIGAYHGALTSATDNIEKLTAKIAKMNEDVDVIEARAEETTRINKFANQRATALREAVTTSARPEDNLLKAQGGAVFETKARTRGNELADRASGKLAAIDDLEQKLAKEIASHDEMRSKIESELATWEGTSATEAKSAMKARAKAEADRIAKAAAKSEEPPTKRLTSADDAVDMAVKLILESDRNRTDAELRSRASETTDRIIGSPDGRLPYDEHMGGPQIGKTSAVANRGALAHRRLDVTNAEAAPWIEQDAEHVLASYLRTVVPDVLLAERFGDPEMTVAFKQINESYNHLIDQTKPGKARDALNSERDNAIKVMAAIRDRLRGVYGWSDNTSQMAKVAQSVKVLNNISDLGSSAIASLSDFAGPLFRWGVTAAIRDGWAPFFQAISAKGEEGKQFVNQMRAIGIGIDVATNARQHSMDEITGAYRPGSPIERTLQTVNDKFFIANGLAPLTDMQKMIAAHAAVHEVINISRRVSEGKATAREIGNLAEGGIDGHMAERIWREFNGPDKGEIVGKVYLPNTALWTDRGAAEAFNGAVYREVNIAVVTPGQEKPLFLSRPVGSLLGQFKTFTAAANERILIANLQRRDAQSLAGVVAAIGLGMMSYKINALTGGQPTSDKPADWFREGVSRSGMLGWLEEGNAALAKGTGGKLDAYRLAGSDKPLTRYAGRNTLDMVLGPTVGKARDLLSVPGPLFRGDWSASDTHQVRRLMPFENMFYLRGLFNQVEAATNSHFNIPERRETVH